MTDVSAIVKAFHQANVLVFEQMLAESPNRFASPYDPTLKDINRGWCHDWAVQVCRQLPEAKHVLFRTFESGHSFVKIDRRYYDAECQIGVCSWRNIPLFRCFLRGIWLDLQEDEIRILDSEPASYVDRRGFRMYYG